MNAETVCSLDAGLPLSSDEVENLIRDWTIETHKIKSNEWAGVIATAKRKMFGKKLKFHLKGMLPNVPSLKNYRDKDFITNEYTRTWTKNDWPDNTTDPEKEPFIACEFGDNGYLMRRGGLTRISLELLARTIELLKPRSVLEVGAGNGLNLMVLSSLFPDVEFTGVELTAAGVERAKSTQQQSKLPDAIANYCPRPNIDPTAFQRVNFTQGDASALEFDDNSFDLVFTKLAVEQMENIKHLALPEIARVSAGHLVLNEPFRDFNADSLRQASIQAKNYLNISIDELTTYGIEPVYVFASWPQKLTGGNGYVVARKC